MALPSRGTVGFSADDAGIGALPDRKVILFDEDRWGGDMNQWYAQYYPGITIENRKLGKALKKVSPEPTINSPRSSNEPALVGLHGSADSSWGNPLLPAEQDMAKSAKIEAFKLLSDENSLSVGILQSINPDMFILLRLFAKFDSNGHDPASFLARVLPKAMSFYEQGIRYMEVHNEPNLTIEGQGKNWSNGAEFGAWFLEVAKGLREAMPEVQVGFPGLSPGPSFDKRYEGYQFYQEADAATSSADWIGCHCYWTHDDDDVGSRTGGMRSRDGGEYYKRLDTKGKPLLITEFSNPSSHVSKAEKAQQYIRYYRLLDGVHSAYCFISSASSGFPHETWNASPIAHIIGQRNTL
jgi:hypothetical protein